MLAISLTDQEFKVRPFHLPERSRASTPVKEEALPLSLANTDQAGGQNGDCWPVRDCWKEGCKGGSHQRGACEERGSETEYRIEERGAHDRCPERQLNEVSEHFLDQTLLTAAHNLKTLVRKSSLCPQHPTHSCRRQP